MINILLTISLAASSAFAYETNPFRSELSTTTKVLAQRAGRLEGSEVPCTVTLGQNGQDYVLQFNSRTVFGEFYDPYAHNPSSRPDRLESDRISLTKLGARAAIEGTEHGELGDTLPASYHYRASLDFGEKDAVLSSSSHDPGHQYSYNYKCIFN